MDLKRTVLILAGLVLIFFAARNLSLVFGGEMEQAVIDEAKLVKVKSQLLGGRHSTAKFTGLYILKTRVKYHFDVYPTPFEALKRGSESPLYSNVSGRDTMSDTSTSKHAKHAKGERITVLYLKPFPQINAAYQPKNLKFYGGIDLAVGLLLVVWGNLIRSRREDSSFEKAIQNH